MADANIKDGEAVETNNEIDANIAKHLDIAIEAQDGKVENTDTETSSENNDGENKEAGTTNKPEDRSSGDGNTNAQPNATEKAKEETKQTHGAKDLTLEDGTVVRGGAERRFYEQRNIAREQLANTERQLNDFRTKYEESERKYKDLESTVSNLHGADPVQVKVGLNIVRDLQRDPQGTMKKLLAEVIAQGYTIEGIGAGIDTAAITRLIEERMPKNTATETDIDKITADATAEAEQFFNQFPDAKPHDELLARMLSDNPGLSLQSAYYQLKNAFAEKGFDWSRSLQDNVGTSSQPNNENGGNENNQQQRNTPALPNGNNGQGTDVVVNRGNISHESEDTGDIVKAAMREAGMNI